MSTTDVSPREPIVKRALGTGWELLPEILRRNFDVSPGNDDKVELVGRMHEIRYSLIGRLIAYPGQLLGALVPFQGNDIGIRIYIRSFTRDPRFMYWQRVHYFPRRPVTIFSSRMEYLERNEFIERVRFGFGMRMKATFSNDTLKFEAVCYQLDLLGLEIKLPNWALMGTGVIRERQISRDEFEMSS